MIFFLDFDGVVNTPRVCSSLSSPANGNMFGWFDPISVNFINKWAEYVKSIGDDDVEIVVSSTWRLGQTWMGMSQVFGAAGIYPRLHRDWATRRPGMTVDGVVDIRGFQIRDWLTEHPDETQWVIIDDDSDFMDDQLPRHIHCDYDNGILVQTHRDALDIFNRMYNVQK